jgi:PilZ domain
MSNDKRRRPRKQLNLPAWIDVGNDAHPQRCTVIDMSDSGARLAVDDIECLPDRFHLGLSRYGQSRQSCNIVWRTHDEVGIEFIASPQAEACDADGGGAPASERGNLEMLTGRISEDDPNEATDRTTAYLARSIADDGVSARLLRKVSVVLAHGLRRGRHPM